MEHYNQIQLLDFGSPEPLQQVSHPAEQLIQLARKQAASSIHHYIQSFILGDHTVLSK
ncbi:hypothetical protein J723_3308 [Acinetobacter sp. 1264765]|nr:hypothetical protein J723_3308 [Acinetobacter sp. 1264765]